MDLEHDMMSSISEANRWAHSTKSSDTTRFIRLRAARKALSRKSVMWLMRGLKQRLEIQDCPAAVSTSRGGRRRLPRGPALRAESRGVLDNPQIQLESKQQESLGHRCF